MEQNLSALFYIKNDSYHRDDVHEEYGSIRDLNKFKLSTIELQKFSPSFYKIKGATEIQLKTMYPGILIGSGYSHPALHDVDTKKPGHDDVGDFQLGFFFDHTTGLPVIPGSSVKGVLKSVFPYCKKPMSKKKEVVEAYEEIQTRKKEYVNALIGKTGSKIKIDKDNWDEIFFSRKQVFFDAYISNITDGLFYDDYITPHGDNPFKEPKPIRFLKVAPGVEFTFQFRLFSFKNNDGAISIDQMGEVFKQILLDFGIGAKRNVGYGALTE